MVVCLGMLTIDVTAVRVALPAIQHEIGATDGQQAWVVNGYLLSLGVLVVAGGRAGDLYGRRRVFLAGLLLFTVSSACCALSSGPAVLVAARVAQGAGAAVMTPGIYAILTDAYASGPAATLGPTTTTPSSRGRDPHQRDLAWALGLLTGSASIGLSAGPLLGGALVDSVGWRWIFVINLPLGLLAAGLVWRSVREQRTPGSPRLDVVGLCLLALGLTLLNVGLMNGGEAGWWCPGGLGLAGLGVVVLAAFVAIELRVDSPLVDLSIFRHRGPAAANAVGACAQFVSTSLTVLVAIYLQDDLGHSALVTGLMLLPMTLPLAVAAPMGGRLTGRFGAGPVVLVGMTGVTLGTAGVALGGLGGRYAYLVPGLVIFGAAFAVVLTATTTALMGAAGSMDRGVVSGVYNTSRNVGASLGVGVTSPLLVSLAVHHPPDVAFALVMGVVALVAAVGALAAGRLGGPVRPVGTGRRGPVRR